MQFLQHHYRLGCDLWIKRDDAISGAEAGNKLRKLEFLLDQALHQQCDTILTCGGVQSNHARTTAIVCAQLGLRCVLFLRTSTPQEQPLLMGNLLLDTLAGAEVHWLSHEHYRHRDEHMNYAAHSFEKTGAKPFVIPEGGSNAIGSLGYVFAMHELRTQLDAGLGGAKPFDAIVQACGSGGTTAGVTFGIALSKVAQRTIGFSVCENANLFRHRIQNILTELSTIITTAPSSFERKIGDEGQATLGSFDIDDAAQGPAYGQTTLAQREFLKDMARSYGLILDPVYTGKALFGLALAIQQQRIPIGSRILFLHTGGLPGLLADPTLGANVVNLRIEPRKIDMGLCFPHPIGSPLPEGDYPLPTSLAPRFNIGFSIPYGNQNRK